MRALFLVALLIVALMPLPGAAAKPATEDPSGDPQLTVLGLPAASAPAGQGEAIDLLAMDVGEDAETLTFTLTVTNLDAQVSFADYRIYFSWGKSEYAVQVQRSVMPGVGENTFAYIRFEDEEGGWEFADLEHRFDLSTNTITVVLPKVYILSDNGRYPLLGDSLTDVYVEGRSHLAVFQFSTDAYDRMPDGEEVVKYDLLFGDVAAGALRLDAVERVRVSNGGATTFVYQVQITNKADDDQSVALALTEMPEGWNGTVQSPVLVPGGSDRNVAILVSVPFAHEHGGFSSFNVSATSEDDSASFASVRLGVLHTPIPQPAGHHSELYLHASTFNSGVFAAAFPYAGGFMNTEAAHEGDAEEASANGGGGDGFNWWIPLDPGLRMGLDFDLDRAGEIAGSIVGHTQATGTVRGEIYLTNPANEDGILLADTDSVDIALELSNPAPFKLTLTPTEEADYIPYARGQNMHLILFFESGDEGMPSICCLPGMTPGLKTADFKMSLPLNEYHDKLTGLSERASALSLKADGPVEKAGLPGSTMTYAFTLKNSGSDAEVIDVDLAGTDAALGTLVPAGPIELAGGESREITLAVAVPTGRNPGEEIEVLIFAHAQADPSKSAIARTKTIVAEPGSDEVVSDESDVLLAAQQAENEAPLGGTFLAMGAFAAAALMLRRRRG